MPGFSLAAAALMSLLRAALRAEAEGAAEAACGAAAARKAIADIFEVQSGWRVVTKQDNCAHRGAQASAYSGGRAQDRQLCST